MQESDRWFRALADHTENVLWIVCGDRDELVYVSAAFDRVYGRNSEKILIDFDRLATYFLEDDRQRSREFWARCREGLTVDAEADGARRRDAQPCR